MSDVILIKRDSTPGLAPTTSQLALGELAVNTYDGKIYLKKDDGVASVIEVGFPVPDNSVSLASIQDGVISAAKMDGTVSTQTATTGAIALPSGTTAQRDAAPVIGGLRWNTTEGALEAYNGTDWTLYKSANGIDVDSTGIHLSGSFTGSLTATGDITAYSDARLKTDWAGFSDDILLKATTIQYGTFTRNDIEENTRHIGVTAQSLQKVFPEAVRENKDGILSVNYGPAALSLVLALNEKVLELEQKIEELKDK